MSGEVSNLEEQSGGGGRRLRTSYIGPCFDRSAPADVPLPCQVSIPDELPAEAAGAAGAAGLRLSMAAGDFVEVYEGVDQAGRFDCVATCFFIDTAHNIIRYMEVIRHCLKVGMHR